MPIPSPFQRRDALAVVTILLVAAFMRFYQAGIVEFFHDDAMLATLAQEMVAGEALPLVGINSSVGIPNPPASVYVMALPFAVSGNPAVAIACVMLLNVLGAGLLWLIARRYFGFAVALGAGLAYAVNPWAVLYSRKIWAQDLHTPLILLALLLGLYGFWEAGKGRGRWMAQVLCLPIFLFALQVHFAAWLLLPLYFALIWFGRRNISKSAFAVSLLLAALVLAPYGIGLAQTLQADPTRITDAIGRSEAGAGIVFTTDAVRYAVYLTTGIGMETWLAPDQQTSLMAANLTVVQLGWLFFLVLALIGFLRLLLDTKFEMRWRVLILLWIVIPFAAFLPSWTPVYGHYFIPVIPALMLVLGLGLDWFLTWLRQRAIPNHPAGLYVVTIGILWLTQVMWWGGALAYVDTHEIPYPGFTTPLHYLEDVRAELANDADVVVVSHGMWWLTHHESVVWSVLLNDTAQCVRTLKGDGYAVLPDHPFAVLIAPDAPLNPVEDFYETANSIRIPLREGGGEYIIYRFEAAPEWTTPLTDVAPVTFDGGVQLTGYALDNDRLTLVWQLPVRNPHINYQYSAQLLDAAGNKLEQRDTLFWYGRHWCAGDTLITWTDMPALEDATTLRVSLYTLGAGKDAGQYFSANVLDTAGNPAGNWVDIPLR